ncbi:ferredoxin [Streptosporangium longisporum]|uniref:Ferredoxin n=1 Tax=Streptosporangium longisporum TaxID=46187 RepID=A0ABP6LIY9_9ACTN
MRADVERDICIGAGMCVLTAPAVFDQDDDGIVVVLTEEIAPGDEAAVRRAVTLCPSGAIRPPRLQAGQ